jgi:H/ACA ribonucleoprotein complex subunit 2
MSDVEQPTTIAGQKKKDSKKESSSNKKSSSDEKTYEERVKAVNIISHPLASKKSTKKAHKLVKKAAQAKIIRRGVKEVVKGLRKGEQGLAILAGDIYPLDVYSYLPILLEEKKIPYLFVPSKQDLGAAACTKRPTSVVLIKNTSTSTTTSAGKGKNDFDGKDLMDALIAEAKEYDPLGV